MLNIPCDRAISCPGVNGLNTDFPITNYSSEEPDRELFVGLNWGWDLNLPLLGTNWTHSSCLGICVSSISQDDADLCAARANLLCLDDPGGNPELGDGGGGLPPLSPPFTSPTTAPKRQLWYNEPQSCTVLCTDGKANTYTVPARTFVSYSLFQSNSMAHSYACKQAEKLRTMCFGDLFDWACVGQPDIEDVLEVTPGTHPPYTFNVSSGSLPDGLNLYPDTDTSTLLAGTPTKAGTFVFSIRATDVLGQTNEKQFTIDILGVENPDTIPHAKCDQPYTYTFSPTGGHGPYTFLEDIANPPPGGLILNLNGTLSGIPTVLPETRVMKFLLTDSSTPPRSCMIAVDFTTDGPKFMNTPTTPTPECAAYSFDLVTLPTNCTFAGSVPPGMSLNAATGNISGNPNVRGSHSFSITATDPEGQTNNKTFTIFVTPTTDTQTDPDGFTITVAKSIADIQWSDGGNYTTADVDVDWNASTGILHFRLKNRPPITPTAVGHRVAFLGRCAAAAAYNVQYTVYWTFNTDGIDNLAILDDRCITAQIPILNPPNVYNTSVAPGVHSAAGIAVPIGPPVGNYLRFKCQADMSVGNYVDVYYKIFI